MADDQADTDDVFIIDFVSPGRDAEIVAVSGHSTAFPSTTVSTDNRVVESNETDGFVDLESVGTTGATPSRSNDDEDNKHINVSEPDVVEEKDGSKYISYTIFTEATRILCQKTIQGLLVTMLVPALPEKGITTLGKQRFDEEFVERRRRELERFIQRVCSHPMLKYCRHLQAFLEAPELTGVAEGYPLSKTDEMFKVFSGFGVAISKVASNTEMDDFLKNEMKYVANVEKEMHMMETSCGKMVQRRKELADSLSYVSSVSTPSSIVGSGKHLASAMNVTSKVQYDLVCCVCRIIIMEQSSADGDSLEYVFRDYGRMVLALKTTLENLVDKYTVHAQSQRNSLKKKDKWGLLHGKPGKDKVAAEAELEWQTSVSAEDSARRYYENALADYSSEKARFENEMIVSIKNAIRDSIMAHLKALSQEQTTYDLLLVHVK